MTFIRRAPWFVTSAKAGSPLAGRWVYVQRRSSLGQWVNRKKVRLGSSGARRFKLDLPRGRHILRMFMTTNQAGTGYSGATAARSSSPSAGRLGGTTRSPTSPDRRGGRLRAGPAADVFLGESPLSTLVFNHEEITAREPSRYELDGISHRSVEAHYKLYQGYIAKRNEILGSWTASTSPLRTRSTPTSAR